MSLLSLNIGLNVDDLLNNKIPYSSCLGNLTVDENGKICLIDNYQEDDTLSIPSSEKSLEEYQLEEKLSTSDFDIIFDNKNFDIASEERSHLNLKIEKLSDKLTKVDTKIKFKRVLSQIKEITKEESIEEDPLKDETLEIIDKLIDDISILSEKYNELEEKFEAIKPCNCGEKSNEKSEDKKHIYTWDKQTYENMETTKHKFVKYHKGKIILCDLTSNCLGVTLSNEMETEIVLNGIVIVEEYKKNICNVGRKCSIKDGKAITGSQWTILNRIDENHIEILLK